MQLEAETGFAAEALEVRTEVAPEAQPQTPLEVEPHEERHALRPSPVPREHPVWSPPVEQSSTGKHAFRDDDPTGENGTAR